MAERVMGLTSDHVLPPTHVWQPSALPERLPRPRAHRVLYFCDHAGLRRGGDEVYFSEDIRFENPARRSSGGDCAGEMNPRCIPGRSGSLHARERISSC